MYLIFPWMKRPWLLLSFFVAYVVCELCRNSLTDEAIVRADFGMMLMISAGISLAGMIGSAAAQRKAAEKQQKYLEDAAKAAANTPQAKAQRKLVAAAAKRIEADDYEGLNVGQKRDMMRQALEGYFASVSGVETQLRQLVGQMDFGKSAPVQEALSEMYTGAKDVAAKTATAAGKLAAELGQMEKRQDVGVVAGTPDTLAQSKMQIGQAKALAAQQIGEAGAAATAGIAGLASQTLMMQQPYGYKPWWQEKTLDDALLEQYAGGRWPYHSFVQQSSGVPVFPPGTIPGTLSGGAPQVAHNPDLFPSTSYSSTP